MSKALEQLMRVNDALANVSVTPAGRKKLAQIHMGIVLAAHGVSDRMREIVARVEDDDPAIAHHWQAVRQSAAKLMAENSDGYVGDAEHMIEYCRLLVAAFASRGVFPDDELDKLNAAADQYLREHLRSSDDYAPHRTDTLERVMVGCDIATGMTTPQFEAWLMDIDVLKAKGQRHEYSSQDLHRVRVKLANTGRVLLRDDPRGKELVEMLDQQLNEIAKVADRHALGPAHLEALEHQWRCYKFNSGIAPRIRDNAIGALQQYTITALAAADTFCWAPQTTHAVMAAAEGLPKECAPSVSALGDIAQVNRSGWWWFQEPVPIQTTGTPDQPVVALLWRYGLQDVPPPPDFPHLRSEPRVGMWFQTFVLARVPLNGREQEVCIPTTAWIWHDGTPLEVLPQRLLREYNRVYADGKMGDDYASPDVTVAASLAFSKFFMAAAAWLRQRIVVESHGGQGVRQAARQLQREHKLSATPRVRVIELRRSEYVKRDDTVQADGTGRRLSVRFVVKGFWRNQWYASRKEHAPKYIESYLKGPADAPLKAAQPTVYVVRR